MKNEIQVPLELFDGRFDLKEIGTICLILSTPHLEKEAIDKWDDHGEIASVVHNLMKKKYITIDENENNQRVLTINIEYTNQEPEKMTIKNAIKQLTKTYHLDDEELNTIEEMMEEIAFKYYSMGYDDGKIDCGDGTFTAYGKSEDY
jgi:hypothetical protein